MSIRLIASWLLGPKRIWVAALCATVAITAVGVPCLCVCMGHAASAPELPSASTCHHESSEDGDSDHAGSNSHCPPASACIQDQAPAVSIQTAPSVEQSSMFLCTLIAPYGAPSEDLVLLKARVSPDRGPPIPPSTFDILRL